jgi:hypothetical protein
MNILSAIESKAALAVPGKVDNAACATPGAIDLPDGNPMAERVVVGKNRRTGKATYSVCAPWLLGAAFSV